jgi:hypothetical protein
MRLDLSWMNGCRVVVSFADPAAWRFDFGGSAGLWVECPWRIIHNGSVEISSEDHRQTYGFPTPVDAAQVATSLLAGTPVRRVEFHEDTADLTIEFGDALRLEIIPFSSGYESWQIGDPTAPLSPLKAAASSHLGA